MKRLTKKELEWLDKLEELVESAPKGIGDKLSSFTIGDPYITIYREDEWEKIEPKSRAGSAGEYDIAAILPEDLIVKTIWFPFQVGGVCG